MLIINEPVVNKSKRETELLVENPMPSPPKLFRQPAGELKPRGRLRNRSCMENKVEQDASVDVEALNESSMRIECTHDRLVIQRPRTDLGGIIGENSSDGLVRPVHLESAKSVTETSNKVQKPNTHDEAINDPVYGNRWREVIDEELWNLDSHQTWSYTLIPQERKAIGCK